MKTWPDPFGLLPAWFPRAKACACDAVSSVATSITRNANRLLMIFIKAAIL